MSISIKNSDILMIKKKKKQLYTYIAKSKHH